MESSVGGVLVASLLLVAVLIMGRTNIFSTDTVAAALLDASSFSAEQIQTVVSIDNATSTGWKLTVEVKNRGTTIIADYANMDFILEYPSTSSPSVVRERLEYVIEMTTTTPNRTISFDSVSSNAVSSQNSTLTFSHTVDDQSNRMLVVGALAEDGIAANCEATGVTYDSVAMTKIADVTACTTFFDCLSLWYLVAPALGGNDVVITYAGDSDDRTGGAITLYNVAQQAPEASDTTFCNSCTNITSSLTTLGSGAWVVDVVGSGNTGGALTPLAGQTERYERSNFSSSGAGGTLYVENPGSVSVDWSQAANRMVQVIAAFAPADPGWTVDFISPDEFEKDQLNPGEVATLVAMLEPWHLTSTTGIVTVVAPNGIETTYPFSE